MSLNVVGTEGGKLVIPSNPSVVRSFARWARSCDFFDNEITLNECLKTALVTKLLNGDEVVLFDDFTGGKGSGRLITFEADEIGNASEDAIIRHYGRGAKQS